MSRRAIAAVFVLLLGTAACKDDTAPVQPDRTTATPAQTGSAAATVAEQAASAGSAATSAAVAKADATAEPATTGDNDDADDADDADGDDDGAEAKDSSAKQAANDSSDADDDADDADDADDSDDSDDEPAKVAQADAKPAKDGQIKTSGQPVSGSPFVKHDAPSAPGGAVKAKGGKAPTAKAPAAKKPAPRKPMATSELKLVKAGEAPRKKLRLQVKKGQVETMKMVLTMDMSVKELKQKQALPPMAMTMRLKVAETRANGDIKYNFTLTKTDVKGGNGHDPRLVAGMKQAMQKIYGLSGHAVVSDRGMNREAKINLPPTVDAQTKQVMQGMEQAMQQIGAPLPVEEVGKGARWTYTTKLSQAGVKLVQVATYDLIKLKGNKVTLRARVKQSAPKQQISAAAGQAVSLLGLDSKGKGKTRMLLNQLAPTRSTMKLKSTMKMGGGNGKTMSIVTGMLIDITSS